MTTKPSLTDLKVVPDPEATQMFANAYQVLNDAIAAEAFPGCAFGVLASGQIVLCDALGKFTYEEEAATVQPATVFDIASVTKVVATTATAMLLNQRGLLDLDTALADLLPAFVAGRSAQDLANEVRLRHLLAHNSGLPGYVELFRTASASSDLLTACLKLPLQADPGSRAEYSDPGFILLGKALEVLTGEIMDAFVQREILAPIGMSDTRFNPPVADRFAIPPTELDSTFRQRVIQGEVQDENAWVLGGVAGHAGLFSNVPDLLKFAHAILTSLDPPNADATTGSLFKTSTIERFARRQPPDGSSRALGWDTPSENSSAGKYFSPNSIGHLGYSGSSLWIDLEAKLVVVLLTNRTWPDRKRQLIREVRPAFHNSVRQSLFAQPNLLA